MSKDKDQYYLEIEIEPKGQLYTGTLQCTVGPFSSQEDCACWQSEFKTRMPRYSASMLYTDIKSMDDLDSLEGVVLMHSSYAEVVSAMIKAYTDAIEDGLRKCLLSPVARVVQDDANRHSG
jgi:hypothetical protein